MRKLERGLHSARWARQGTVLVITGRGLGNATQVPVLRLRVENFLRTDARARYGVISFEVTSGGGALLVKLPVNGTAREPDDDEWEDED